MLKVSGQFTAPENARLKRLLDKKRRALTMPKSQLAELEDEYAELLSRIESAKKRLGIDELSVERFISETEQRFSDAQWYLDNNLMWQTQMKRIQSNLRKSAENGDTDDYRYYQKQFEILWERIRTASRKNSQISLLGGQYEP